MNQRIKELALQAGAVNVWEWASDDVLDTKNMDAKKFAELIVRECINIIKPIETDPVLQYKWLNFYDKENRLKEHFGVEE